MQPTRVTLIHRLHLLQPLLPLLLCLQVLLQQVHLLLQVLQQQQTVPLWQSLVLLVQDLSVTWVALQSQTPHLLLM